jgi:hypothetical protein
MLTRAAADSSIAVGRHRARQLRRFVERRLLHHLVDHAAGRAAPEQHRRRAHQDLDLLEGERVAIVLGAVAHAVEIDVGARREAVEIDVVADVSAFGRADGQAGRVANGALERGGALRLHQRLVDDDDRLRDVADVATQPIDRRRRREEIVARPGAGDGDRRHRRRRCGVIGRLGLGGSRIRGAWRLLGGCLLSHGSRRDEQADHGGLHRQTTLHRNSPLFAASKCGGNANHTHCIEQMRIVRIIFFGVRSSMPASPRPTTPLRRPARPSLQTSLPASTNAARARRRRSAAEAADRLADNE